MWWKLFLLVEVVPLYSHQMEHQTINSLVSECYIIINEEQALVIQSLDSAIQRISLYPVDSAVSFPSTYPLYHSYLYIYLLNSAIQCLDNYGKDSILHLAN